MTSTPFRTLHHICIVVHDIQATEAYYESIGVEGWYDYPSTATPYVELTVPNPEGSRAMLYRVADLDQVQIQLCQPSHHDTPQRRFLDAHGEGVYHLGFSVDDLDSAVESRPELRITSSGRRADGTGFAYFDTRTHAGVVLEVRSAGSATTLPPELN